MVTHAEKKMESGKETQSPLALFLKPWWWVQTKEGSRRQKLKRGVESVFRRREAMGASQHIKHQHPLK